MLNLKYMNRAMIFTYQKMNEEDVQTLNERGYSLGTSKDNLYSFLVNGNLSGYFKLENKETDIFISYEIDEQFKLDNYLGILINQALLEIENEYPNKFIYLVLNSSEHIKAFESIGFKKLKDNMMLFAK